MFKNLPVALALLFLSSCFNQTKRVQVIGEKILVKKSAKGEVYYDTLSAVAPSFCFINHHNKPICNKEMQGKVWVCDFFFTHCPSICVKMEKNLMRVNKELGAKSNFQIVSFSIDPARDSVETLFQYASKLGIDNTNWDFLTGEKDSIYAVADKFLANAAEDKNSPGGFIHDGNFVLIDKQGRIRGFYDGTDDAAVDKIIEDLKALLSE